MVYYYHTVQMTAEDDLNVELPTDAMLGLTWLSVSPIRDGKKVAPSMGEVYHAAPFIDRDSINLE